MHLTTPRHTAGGVGGDTQLLSLRKENVGALLEAIGRLDLLAAVPGAARGLRTHTHTSAGCFLATSKESLHGRRASRAGRCSDRGEHVLVQNTYASTAHDGRTALPFAAMAKAEFVELLEVEELKHLKPVHLFPLVLDVNDKLALRVGFWVITRHVLEATLACSL